MRYISCRIFFEPLNEWHCAVWPTLSPTYYRMVLLVKIERTVGVFRCLFRKRLRVDPVVVTSCVTLVKVPSQLFTFLAFPHCVRDLCLYLQRSGPVQCQHACSPTYLLTYLPTFLYCLFRRSALFVFPALISHASKEKKEKTDQYKQINKQ